MKAHRYKQRIANRDFIEDNKEELREFLILLLMHGETACRDDVQQCLVAAFMPKLTGLQSPVAYGVTLFGDTRAAKLISHVTTWEGTRYQITRKGKELLK